MVRINGYYSEVLFLFLRGNLNYFHLRNSKKKAPGNDAKFFTTNRKGENHELREELRSPSRDRKRDAVKKVHCQPFIYHCLKNL